MELITININNFILFITFVINTRIYVLSKIIIISLIPQINILFKLLRYKLIFYLNLVGKN